MAKTKRIKMLVAVRELYYAYIKDFNHSSEETRKYEHRIFQINQRIFKMQTPPKDQNLSCGTLKLFS
jgi:hypothetical protein